MTANTLSAGKVSCCDSTLAACSAVCHKWNNIRTAPLGFRLQQQGAAGGVMYAPENDALCHVQGT